MEALLNPALIDAISKITIGTAFFILCSAITYTLYKNIQNGAAAQNHMLEIIGDLTAALNGVKEAIQKTAESGERTAGQMMLVEKGLNDHTRLVVDTLDAFVGTFGSDLRFMKKLAESEFKQIGDKLDGLRLIVDKLPDTDALKTELARVCAVIAETRQPAPVVITDDVKVAILAEAEKPRLVNGAGESEAD